MSQDVSSHLWDPLFSYERRFTVKSGTHREVYNIFPRKVRVRPSKSDAWQTMRLPFEMVPFCRGHSLIFAGVFTWMSQEVRIKG